MALNQQQQDAQFDPFSIYRLDSSRGRNSFFHAPASSHGADSDNPFGFFNQHESKDDNIVIPEPDQPNSARGLLPEEQPTPFNPFEVGKGEGILIDNGAIHEDEAEVLARFESTPDAMAKTSTAPKAKATGSEPEPQPKPKVVAEEMGQGPADEDSDEEDNSTENPFLDEIKKLKAEAESLQIANDEIAVDTAVQGLLKVRLLNGTGFPEGVQSYVKLYMYGKSHGVHSEVSTKASPTWNEDFLFHFTDRSQQQLVFMAKDKSRIGSYIGFSVLNFIALAAHKRVEKTITLKGGIASKATMKVSCKWIPDGIMPRQPGTTPKSYIHVPRLRLKVSKAVAYAGETLSGKVKFSVGPPVTIKEGLFVRFSGKEELDVVYRGAGLYGQNNILTKAYAVVTPEAPGTAKVIGPGRYSWKFTVKLHDPMPPSFVDFFGYIRYALYATVDKGNKYYYSLPIKVSSPSTGILAPRFSPAKCQKIIKKHNVEVLVRLSSWCLLLGRDKKVGFHMEMTNTSSHHIGKVKIKFVEKRFGISTNSNEVFQDEHILAKRNLGPVCPARTGRFEKDFNISLPKNYNQPSITKAHGGKRIFIQHYVSVSTSKMSVAHKHRQTVIIPINLIQTDPDRLPTFKGE